MVLRGLPLFLARLNDSDKLAILGDPKLHRSINQAIAATDKREKRKRRLTACLTVYVVLALSLFRRLSIPNALTTLLSCLRDVVPDLPFRPASESAVCEARYRLGQAPLKLLFEMQAATVSPPPTFFKLRSWAIDGVRFQIPDTPENLEKFGKPTPTRGSTAYPVALAVALVDTEGHRIRCVELGEWKASERDAVGRLIEPLTAEDVVLLDRGFPSGELFNLFIERGVHFLCRLTATWNPHVVKCLDKGDSLVRIAVKVPQSPTKPGGMPRIRTVHVMLRMLVYRCGKTVCRIITDLLNPTLYPALELAKQYHERWEAEIVYDEVKNHFATGLHGNADLCIRSKLPEGVLQELYAVFTAFNLVREIIVTAGETYGVEPRRISFVAALTAILLTVPRLVASTPDDQQALLQRLYNDIAVNCKLRPRRQRQYPRKVKVKMSDFGCKTSKDVQTKVELRATMTDPPPARTWSRKRHDQPSSLDPAPDAAVRS